jgi:transposase InsO family protein
MVQLDTSEHDWLSPGRKPAGVGTDGGEPGTCHLILAKDDATGTIFARFYETDSTQTNMDLIKRYVEAHGRPVKIYLDRATHFKVTPRKGSEADLDKEFRAQIQRAMRELDIELIFAGSPQAKGRVEREFRTRQDRLIKLMRWDHVKTMDEANEHLNTYMPKHDKRFMVKPRHEWNLHRPKAGFDLDAIFSVQDTRKVTNDHVVRFHNKFYQLLVDKDGPNLRAKNVIVEQRLNGNIKIRYAGKYYDYAIID